MKNIVRINEQEDYTAEMTTSGDVYIECNETGESKLVISPSGSEESLEAAEWYMTADNDDLKRHFEEN